MINILLMLLLPVIRAQRTSPVPSCPASCVVCSEDAIICQRLANIIDAPDSTQALFLTEGSISTVQPASLSDLSNITVIGLSHNHIAELGKESFRNLPFLHTLLLDHNFLTSESLQGGALTNLTQLEVLALGHNIISMIQGGWFQGTKALRSLKLEGNLLSSLNAGSFPLNDLRELENLDVSDNLINHLDRHSFRGLVSLQTLDLSRNRLSSAPVEAFSYLTWLTNLNLDLNSWNCSCQLLELAAFLSTFIQQPDKTLYNGRRMVCVSADNPAVTTVLELTDANCVPSNQNITVQIETRGSVTPQLYARDLAITAVICFIGGVGLTLLMVLIYYQVSRKKKLKEIQRLKEQEEGSNSVANHHVNHLDFSGRKRRDFFLQANSSQQWKKEAMTLDARTNDHNGQFRFRIDEDGGYFRCPDCSSDAPRLNPVFSKMNGGMEADRERRKIRMMTEEDRKRIGVQQRTLNWVSSGNTNSSSNPQREAFSQRTETLPLHKNDRDADNHRTDTEAKSKGHGHLHCENCHRTYRSPEQNLRQGRVQTCPTDSALFDGFPSQHRLNDRGRNSQNNSDMVKNVQLRRETRNVSFDLQSPRTLEQGNGKGDDKNEEEAARDKEKGKEGRHKVQTSHLLKVKLNLNPLRKSKVHPRRKNEQGHSEKSSSKKSKGKKRDGKEREEKEEKGKSGKKKLRKSSKTEGEKEKEKEDRGEEGQRSKTSAKKTVSKSESGDKESTEKSQHPDNSQPAQSSSAADQSASTVVSEHGQSLQSTLFQGAGLALGSAQFSSQLPPSIFASDRNRATSLSLLGSAGSQQSGSSFSLQGGNFLLSAMATSGPAPSVTFSRPNVAPSGAPDTFSRQAADGVMSAVPSLIANTVHANPFQTSATPQAGVAVNPVPIQAPSQSQLPPDNSPFVAKLKPEPAQGPAIQTAAGLDQVPAEAQAPLSKDNLPTSQHGMSEETLHSFEPVTTVENISNRNSQTETVKVPGSSTVDMSSGAVALTEGAAARGSGDSMQAPGEQSGSSTEAALLQQEYLPEEEGSSSPRRKLKLVLPEKTSSRPPTALERKIR